MCPHLCPHAIDLARVYTMRDRPAFAHFRELTYDVLKSAVISVGIICRSVCSTSHIALNWRFGFARRMRLDAEAFETLITADLDTKSGSSFKRGLRGSICMRGMLRMDVLWSGQSLMQGCVFDARERERSVELPADKNLLRQHFRMLRAKLSEGERPGGGCGYCGEHGGVARVCGSRRGVHVPELWG